MRSTVRNTTVKIISDGELIIDGIPNTQAKTIRIEKINRTVSSPAMNDENIVLHIARYVCHVVDINSYEHLRPLENIEQPKIQIREQNGTIHTLSQATIRYYDKDTKEIKIEAHDYK